MSGLLEGEFYKPRSNALTKLFGAIKSAKPSSSSATKVRIPDEREPTPEDVQRREDRKRENEWWDAQRAAATTWNDSKRSETRGERTLIVAPMGNRARIIMRNLVENCAEDPTNVRGIIISPHERLDKLLQKCFPKMEWFKFYGPDAIAAWDKHNKSGKQFFVLSSGGILGNHIDDDLLEVVDKNCGHFIVHQPVTNLLDMVYEFDHVFYNGDVKAAWSIFQGFYKSIDTYNNDINGLIKDPNKFLYLNRANRQVSPFILACN
jgi:hypothetical protein